MWVTSINNDLNIPWTCFLAKCSKSIEMIRFKSLNFVPKIIKVVITNKQHEWAKEYWLRPKTKLIQASQLQTSLFWLFNVVDLFQFGYSPNRWDRYSLKTPKIKPTQHVHTPKWNQNSLGSMVRDHMEVPWSELLAKILQANRWEGNCFKINVQLSTRQRP